MMQFKTVVLPMAELKVTKEKELFLPQNAQKAVSQVAAVIENEARGGWHLHSLVMVPACIYRQKGCLEILLGWIPIIGNFFKYKATANTQQYYTLIFQREA